MKYLSVCSGIEAPTVAWHPLDWRAVAFSEIDRFPSAVLTHHYPDVPNLGDMEEYRGWSLEPSDIDLLVGGTPCQSFSVAGLRKGMDDPRGNLALVFLGIADRLRPRWVVWENVPGVLSSNEGRDFGAFLGGLAELGYGWAYRVLDAQFVRVESHPRAVPQRRRRVFVVGYLGDWRRAAAVLLERESLSGHPPPRRTAGEGATRGTAPSLTGSGRGVERVGESRGQDPLVAETLRDHPRPGSNSLGAIALQTDATPKGQHGVAYTLKLPSKSGGGQPPAVAHPLTASGGSSRSYVAASMAARRLTPRECERLQGFPDDYTQIPYRGKPASECPDGPRYRALGNSMAVNVMRWLGERIQRADSIQAVGRGE